MKTALLFLPRFRAGAILLTFLLLIPLPGCKKDDPAGPNPPQKPVKLHYNLYLADWASERIMVVDTDSNRVIDSIFLPTKYAVNMVVTTSGKKLYAATEGSTSDAPTAYVVDLPSKQIRTIIDRPADFYISPKGTVIIIIADSGTGARALKNHIGLVDTLNDQIHFIDTLDLVNNSLGYWNQSIVFDPARPAFYAVRSDYRLIRYNYQT